MTKEEMEVKLEFMDRQLTTLETITTVALGYISSHLYNVTPELDDSLDAMMRTWEDIGGEEFPYTRAEEIAERVFSDARMSTTTNMQHH